MADQGTEGLLSPWLRSRRFEAARPYLSGRVLDFGCGTGALSELCDGEYTGVDQDADSLSIARDQYHGRSFYSSLDDVVGEFDTVVCLAVIEHVSQPEELLRALSSKLTSVDGGKLVLTTPHPSGDWIHHMGSKFGLFSAHADEEHEELLNLEKLSRAGEAAELELQAYHRFLFGVNQLAVFSRMS